MFWQVTDLDILRSGKSRDLCVLLEVILAFRPNTRLCGNCGMVGSLCQYSEL